MSGRKHKPYLVFGDSLKSSDVDHIEEHLDQLDQKRNSSEAERRSSAYVQVFETMARTVLEQEQDLLSEEEIIALERFSKLCYNARYCLIRLLLRTVNRWHPTSSLESYKKEVGEDGLKIALDDLCLPFDVPSGQEVSVKLEPNDNVMSELSETHFTIKQEDSLEAIDLSMRLDNEDEFFDVLWPQKAGPSRLHPQAPTDAVNTLFNSDMSVRFDSFCRNESAMTTREILGRMNRDQLVALAKEMKCKLKPSSKKDDIADALERHAASQQVLDFGFSSAKKGKGKARDDGLRQTQLTDIFLQEPTSSKPKKNQEQRLRQLAIRRLGSCIRVNFEFYRLVRRLHIIYFRETEHPSDLLLPALLSIFKKRNFTPYKYSRTTAVWVSRTDLLEYERALELDKLLDDIMEEQPETVSKRATKTPVTRRESFVTPVTPSSSRNYATPLKTPSNNDNWIPTQSPALGWDDGTSVVDKLSWGAETILIKPEEKIKKHLEDWMYSNWQRLVAAENNDGVRPRPIGLERFDAGHVYTRMVHKALRVFGKLKEFETELKIIDELLDQRFWCRGKRAKWYERRAIVLGHLVRAEKDRAKKRDIQLRTLEGVKIALLDDDTGIVYRPSLVKRLEDLERKLTIPLEERSRCNGELRQAPVVELRAVRVQPLLLDAHGRPINGKENTPELHKYISITKDTKVPEENKPTKRAGKSSWKGKDDQIVNVEICALEHYENQGYKGFHCETRILTMLFGLLFWDIIFAEVPGAFETPYQTAPLDLCHDSFYRARKKLIDARLQEIQEGKGRDILQNNDEAYRDKAVICVGVSWDLCTREDLLDLVDCLGSNTLGIICQIFCEDYEARRSGGPDLVVWNVQERKCKFVEVKGPGDRPQENQKIWFDSLLRANADVEICKVIDIATDGNNTGARSGRKRRVNTPASTRRKRKTVDIDNQDSEEQDYDKLDGNEDDDDTDELPPAQHLNKRRRIAEPHASSSKTPFPIQTPRRVNRAEVVLTPPKKKKSVAF